MSDMNNIVKLAVDAYHGNVEKYSMDESMEVLRNALIEANGGSTKVDYRAIRDGKCVGLFALVEEILNKTVIEGVQNSDFFSTFVDYRNIALGDQNVFEIEDDSLFYVAEIAEGTQGIRRQRLEGQRELTIPTSLHAVKIYEELNRVLAGRVDFNQMIAKVGKSMEQALLDDVYAVFANITAADLGGTVYFPTAGTYSESALLDVIAHVEAAANGQTATIVGTKKALRNLAPSLTSVDASNDLYHDGVFASFFGSPVMVMPQRHKVNTTTFVYPDDVLTIIATGDKPIKCVTEGDTLIIPGNATDHGDLTMTYFMAQRWGLGVAMSENAGIGRYQFT